MDVDADLDVDADVDVDDDAATGTDAGTGAALSRLLRCTLVASCRTLSSNRRG